MTQRATTRLKIWLVIVGVFVLGCITGASLDSAYRLARGKQRTEMRGERRTEEVFNQMSRDLDLDDRQASEMRAIIDQTRNDYRALRAEARPRYDAIRQNARARIRSLLTPAQQQRFDARIAERDARRTQDVKDDR